ncbi:MAG: hypothetical protein LBC80_02045 [Treponema sp.]|jgi:hypothetical protein|nr:hypothetical protein [Treponema sp.]
MKKIGMMFMAITLLFVIAGCGGGGGGYPVTGITVSYGETEIESNTPLTIVIGEKLVLTGTTIGGTATYWSWEVEEGGEAYIDIEGEDTGEVTITGISEGSAEITVYASNKDNEGELPFFTFTVMVETGEPVTGITVDNDGTPVTLDEELILIDGGELTLTATAIAEGDLPVTWLWEVALGGEAFIDIEDEDTDEVTITGMGEGTAFVTVYASNEDNKIGPKQFTFSVKVVNANAIVLKILDEDADQINYVTGFEIRRAIGDTYQLDAEVTKIIDNSDVTSTATIEWDSKNTNVVTVNNDGEITIVGLGTSKITVTATHGDDSDEVEDTKEFNITVKRYYGANVLFEWHASDNAWENLNSGNTWDIPDSGFFKDQTNNGRVTTAVVYGATATADAGGIRLGSSGTAGQPRIAFGQSESAATSISNFADTELYGQIDLYRKEATLTIEYSNITHQASRYILRVYVNNNGTGRNDSMFRGDSDATAACILMTYDNLADLENPAKGGNASNTLAEGTLVIPINTIVAPFLSHYNEVGLAKAFIGLHTQSGGSGTLNNFITINSIKLEYVSGADAPASFDTVTGLEVKDGADPVANFAINNDGDNKTLTVIATGGDIITVENRTTTVADRIVNIDPAGLPASFTVSGIAEKEGTDPIVVIAARDGYIPQRVLFNVEVFEGEPPIKDPNLIFHWDRVLNGGATNSITGTTATISGAREATYTSARFRSNGANVTMENNGIKVNGTGGAHRAIIGFNATTTTSSTTAWNTINGDFDFSVAKAVAEVGANKVIQFSFGYLINQEATNDGRLIVLQVNNNTGNAAANQDSSPLTVPDAVPVDTSYSRVITAGANQSLKNGDTGTLTGILDPAFFTTSAAITSLQNAFFNIASAGSGGTDAGYEFTITSIKVEYIDSPITVRAEGNKTSIMAGEDATPGEKLQMEAYLGWVKTDAGITWTINTEDVYVPSKTAEGEISISPTGELDAGKDLDDETTIYVFATHNGRTSEGRPITVQKFDAGGPVDPNLIFYWVAEDQADGTFMDSWSSGLGSTSNGRGNLTSRPVSGPGTHPTLHMTIGTGSNGNNDISWDNTTGSKGIIMDGSNTANTTAKILTIGLNANRAVTSTGPTYNETTNPNINTHPTGGQFNFSTLPEGKIGRRVILTGEIMTDVGNPDAASNQRNVAISINNNTATHANTPLSASGNNHRIFQWANVVFNSGSPASGFGTWTRENASDPTNRKGTLTSKTFVLADFNGVVSTLETAYLAILVAGNHTANPPAGAGAKIKITSIRIEYVPE